MPYKKRVQKRSYQNKKTQKIARKVVKEELKKEIETKFFDRVSTGNFDSTTVTAISPVTGFTRGTSPNQYIGSAIKIRSLEVRGQFIASDAPGNICRMLIIQDGAVSGTPNIGTMFANLSYPIYSPLNTDFTDTYRVLKDKLFLLTNDGSASNSFLPKSINYKISGKTLRHMKFTNTSGVIDSGAFWIVLVSDSSATPNPTYILSMRLNYQDA